MSAPLFGTDDEAITALEADGRASLIPTFITQRRELNEAEQVKIAGTLRWLSSRRRKAPGDKPLQNLHKKMFGQVWPWADTYRQTARNILVEAWRIPMDIAQAIDESRYRTEHESCRFDCLRTDVIIAWV